MLSGNPQNFSPEHFKFLSEQYLASYSEAEPFPHTLIDNFLPEEILDEVIDEFPEEGYRQWMEMDNQKEKKTALQDEACMNPAVQNILFKLNSSMVIKFLEKLTGIHGLIPDPHHWGGGLHQIKKGGHLGIHADFNFHPLLNLDRRLNLLVFLNKDWKEEYGGQLELWNKDMTKCCKKILPIFNRCVIFNTTDFTFHGNPDPLNCPKGRTRRSLSLYYYTNGRPLEELSDPHTTIFRNRPNDKSQKNTRDMLINRITPPICHDLLRIYNIYGDKNASNKPLDFLKTILKRSIPKWSKF